MLVLDESPSPFGRCWGLREECFICHFGPRGVHTSAISSGNAPNTPPETQAAISSCQPTLHLPLGSPCPKAVSYHAVDDHRLLSDGRSEQPLEEPCPVVWFSGPCSKAISAHAPRRTDTLPKRPRRSCRPMRPIPWCLRQRRSFRRADPRE